jgi:seryl-tRNA synthetase
MSISSDFGDFLMNFINSVRTANLEWKKEKLAEILELKKRRESLSGELKKMEAALKIEIEKINIQGQADIRMLKDKCDQDVRDYKQFLDAIDDLKERIQRSYSNIPLPLVLTIHRHAKILLNNMWDQDNIEQRNAMERKMIMFLEAVYEDTAYLPGDTKNGLPIKTITLIHQKGNYPSHP